jgi:hypothetical protein
MNGGGTASSLLTAARDNHKIDTQTVTCEESVGTETKLQFVNQSLVPLLPLDKLPSPMALYMHGQG